MTSVILFSPQYREGSEFVSEISKLFSDKELYEFDVVYIKKDVNPLQQQQMLFAIHVADVVIVDCTIPSDTTDGGVYPALTAQINCLNHIIVVSENILPLNIKPYRSIVPIEDGQTLSTSYIVENLPQTVAESIKEDTYDRFPAEEFLTNMEKFMPDMEKMIQDSLDSRKNDKLTSTSVMISYRNSHSAEVESFKNEILNNDSAGRLRREELGLNGTYEVKVLPPASLCGQYEAHSPMRRWMLVGILEDHIRDVDEVWVFESRDAGGHIDYTNSWWTIAEMVMVANINHDSGKKIKIRVYNPETKRFYDSTPEKYLIDLKEDQHKRLARYLSNTRPDTMGPETLNQARQLFQVAKFLRSKLIPKVLKNQLLDNMKANFERAVPKNLSEVERTEMIESMMSMYSNSDELEKYVNDDVFQDSFWNDISYQTTQTTPCFVNNHVDVDTFISIPMKELTNYQIDDFRNASETKNQLITINGKQFKVSKSESDRFLWLATRMGEPTIREGNPPGIERIPIYNVESVD